MHDSLYLVERKDLGSGTGKTGVYNISYLHCGGEYLDRYFL